MGLLYPPSLLVPPYLPSINATAGASCNNTCTSEPPARERETGEERAVEGETGGMEADGRTRTRRWGREEEKKTIKMVAGWRDEPCASAGHVSAACQRVEGGVTVTSQITRRMRQRLLFPIAMAIGDESSSESSESVGSAQPLSTPFSVSCRVLGLVSVASCFPPCWVRLPAVIVLSTSLRQTLSHVSSSCNSHHALNLWFVLSFRSYFAAI